MRREEIGGYMSTSTDGERVRAFVPAPLPPVRALALDGSCSRRLKRRRLPSVDSAAGGRLPRLRNALFVLFIGLAPTSVPASDPTATSTPAAKTVGLFLNEPEAFDGYTLFNKWGTPTIYLIDNQGREVHRWELTAEALFAKLLENGNLLTFANTDQGRYVREVDRNGNILWGCTQGNPHHDFLKMPNGNVLLLSRQRKTPEEAIAAGANPEFIGDGGLLAPHIVEARITGPASCEIVWE